MDITAKPDTTPEWHDPTGRHVRVAFVGKGGSGKSTISGTFARLLARRVADSVVALDSDPLPGMPYALGVAVDDNPIPAEAVVEGPEDGPRWMINPDIDADEFIERYAAPGPDGVRYLQFGNLWGHVVTLRESQFAWSQVVREMDPQRWHIVGDLPGGTRQPMAGWAKYADVVCVRGRADRQIAALGPAACSTSSAPTGGRCTCSSWPTRCWMSGMPTVSPSGWVSTSPTSCRPTPACSPVIVREGRHSTPPPNGPLVTAVHDLVDRIIGLYPEVESTTEVSS